ncbi:MAG: efflux RND transporter periplasmic adaptor subunit, partial [Rhodospirillales bacterium]|nr:efflux RND transporter periplasmic adaptor subunit [Rhodospirillales bacterium]
KSFRVRVALPDDTPLMIGMTTEINVVTAEIADALLLPAAAIAAGRVFVLDGEVVRARPVTLGVRGRDRVQILDGLRDGEAVVAEPPASLSDGVRVRQAGG